MRKQTDQRKGFTLTEMLVTIAIIVILVAIAIPSFIGLQRSLEFKKVNNYAKEIFMAAQSNLVDRKAAGTLGSLRTEEDGNVKISRYDNALFPPYLETDEEGNEHALEYFYVTSAQTGGSTSTAFDRVLPKMSIDATLRDKNILIEYNPYTGNVYAVFYSEKGVDLTYDNVTRDKTARKRSMLGYYDGSDLFTYGEVRDTSTPEIKLDTDGQEAILNISVPIPDRYLSDPTGYAAMLTINAKVVGDQKGGSFDLTLTNPSILNGNTLVYTYVVDSLAYDTSKNVSGFGGMAQNNTTDGTIRKLGDITDESTFNILPGENVTITANVSSTDGSIEFTEETVSGVNPMFAGLQVINEGTENEKYELYIGNGRHLQNLNAIAPAIAQKVKSVYFTEDIYWNETQTYYNDKYNSGNLYTNQVELPARGLPNFVPITSPYLFGSAYFENSNSGSLFSGVTNRPWLTDADDGTTYAEVFGGKHKVFNLNINASDTNIYKADNTFYVYGNKSSVGKDRFTGLFSYAESAISSLYVVNSSIVGTFADGFSAAGSLVGACGHRAFLYDCGAYIDKDDSAFSLSDMNSKYGVTGYNAVGGLVGYAKSHNSVSGELLNNSEHLAFSQCFAAVPVKGTMVGNEWWGELVFKDAAYGYTNGIGGLVGVSILTNFYKCYSSGAVSGENAYTPGDLSQLISSALNIQGVQSRGIGGFVGTSHGTRYKNCFSTGEVSGTNDNVFSINMNGIGGFIGVTFLDEQFSYRTSTGSTKTVTQDTKFESCYCAGVTTLLKNGGGYSSENFCGRMLRLSNSGGFLEKLIKLLGERAFVENPGSYYAQGDYFYKIVGAVKVDFVTVNDYIFKDSYYLNQYVSVDEDTNNQSNLCAQVVQYQNLQDLPAFQQSLLNANSNKPSQPSAWNIPAWFPYCSKLNTYNNRGGFATGFKSVNNGGDWEPATQETTHPYGTGIVYPFTKLAGMDYYGDWPGYIPSLGLAYYERYENGSDGYYLEGTNTSTLKDDTKIVGDGYAILVNGRITGLKINGISCSKDAMLTDEIPGVVIGHVSYRRYLLTTAALEKARQNLRDGDFYSKLEITSEISGSGSKTYTVYFNPDFALTQVNSSMANAGGGQSQTAVRPVDAEGKDLVPSQIMIRTPRQLYELSKASRFWGDNYHYIQQFDIDMSSDDESYRWTKYAGVEKANVVFQPIGNSNVSFDGTYDGGQGYVDCAKLNSLKIASPSEQNKVYGIFGVIGQTGSVANLDVSDTTITITGAADAAGVLAGINYGKVTNVKVSTDSVSVQNVGVYGLLAGKNSGTIENCEVAVSKAADGKSNVTVTATEAVGGLVGLNVNSESQEAVISNCKLSLDNLTGNLADYVGGFVGKMVSGSITGNDNSPVSFNSVKGEGNVGGFAGYFSGEMNGMTLELNTVASSAGMAASFAAETHTAALNNVAVTVKGDVTGQTGASGFVGDAVNLTANQIVVTLEGNVTGSSKAAGFAVSMDGDSEVRVASVELKRDISAENGTAAGFAVKNNGAVHGGHVYLNNTEISGKYAAGFCGISTIARDSDVSGSGTIVGSENAAGFANTVVTAAYNIVVSPVRTDSSDLAAAYKSANSRLTVSSVNGYAAGFANAVGTAEKRNAAVQNVAVLGTVSGRNAAGVVNVNNGTVMSTMANVDMTSGSAFAGQNNNMIHTSYVWYKGNAEASFVGDNQNGAVIGSYAAPLGSAAPFGVAGGTYENCYNVASKEGESGITGVKQTSFDGMQYVTPAMLTGSDSDWGMADINHKYPYNAALSIQAYPFAMLKNVPQYGDWKAAPIYSYGVAYYEVIETANENGKAVQTINYHIVELSKPELTENDELNFNNISSDPNRKIVESGYAVFYNADLQFTSITWGENTITLSNIAEFKDENRANLDRINPQIADYKFKKIASNSNAAANGSALITVTAANPSYGESAVINPYFTDTIKPGETLTISTCQELQNVKDFADNNFIIAHNLDMDFAFSTIETLNGSLTADEGIVVSNLTSDGAFIGTVGESGSISNLTLDTVKTTSLVDTLKGKMTDVSVGGFVGTNVVATVVENAAIETLKVESANAASVIGSVGGSVNGLTVKDSACTDSMLKIVDSVAQVTNVTVTGGSCASVMDSVSGTVTNLTVTNAVCSGSVVNSVANGANVDTVTVTGTSAPVVVNTVNGTVKTLTVEKSQMNTYITEIAESGSVNGMVIYGYSDEDGMEISDYLVGTLKGSLSGLKVTGIGCMKNLICNVSGTDNKKAVLSNSEITGYIGFSGILGEVKNATISDVKVTSSGIMSDRPTALEDAPAIASVASPIGLFANKMEKSSVEKVTIIGTTDAPSGMRIGVISDEENKQTIVMGILAGQLEDTKVKTLTVDLIELQFVGYANEKALTGTAATADRKPVLNATVGGIVGDMDRNSSLDDVTLKKVNVSTTVAKTTGENTQPVSANITVGGFVGKNAGTISGVEATEMDVTFTPGTATAKLNVVLGGMVGEMVSESDVQYVSGIASCLIENKDADHVNRVGIPSGTVSDDSNVMIGGAIGKDSGNEDNPCTYMDTHVEATVMPGTGTNTVGKFVGYITNGIFNGCSAWDASSAAGFYGDIAFGVGELGAGYYKSNSQTGSSVTARKEDNDGYVGMVKFDENTEVYTYKAQIKECYYSIYSDTAENNTQTYKLSLEDVNYYSYKDEEEVTATFKTLQKQINSNLQPDAKYVLVSSYNDKFYRMAKNGSSVVAEEISGFDITKTEAFRIGDDYSNSLWKWSNDRFEGLILNNPSVSVGNNGTSLKVDKGGTYKFYYITTSGPWYNQKQTRNYLRLDTSKSPYGYNCTNSDSFNTFYLYKVGTETENYWQGVFELKSVGSKLETVSSEITSIDAVREAVSNSMMQSLALMDNDFEMENVEAVEEVVVPEIEVTEPMEEVTEPVEDDVEVEETEPTEEVTEPEAEVTEPAEEVTEPEAEVTEPAEEVTEPEVEVTEPTEEVTEPEVVVTEPTEEITEPEVEVNEPIEEVTEPEVEVTEPVEEPTEETTPPAEMPEEQGNETDTE